MAESSGAGDSDCNRGAAGKGRSGSPLEEVEELTEVMFEPYVPASEKKLRDLGSPVGRRVPAVATILRRGTEAERDQQRMDEELRALGLWEEDMTEEQKIELLKVVADSRETALREEEERQNHYARRATRVKWDKRETPVKGLVKPSMTDPQLAKVHDDEDEWPGAFGGPSRAVTKGRGYPPQPTKKSPPPPGRRGYAMDQPLHFLWDEEDEGDDLYDVRLPSKEQLAQAAGGQLSDDEYVPPERVVRTPPPVRSTSRMFPLGAGAAQPKIPPPFRSTYKMFPLGAEAARPEEEQESVWDGKGIMSSWETLHEALKETQAAQGLPVRPWGQTRDPSPIGPKEEKKEDDVQDAPSKQEKSPDQDDAHLKSATEDGDGAQGGGQ